MTDTPAGTGENVATPWSAGITDPDLRGFVELKKWESPEKVVESYRNLEKHMGVPAERLLRLPEKLDDAEAMSAIYEKIGMAPPKEAKDYELPVPEGFNTDYAERVAAKAKELGIPKHMLKGLAEFQNEQVKLALDADEAATNARVEGDLAKLRAEWGGTHDTTMALAKRTEETFKKELGLTDADALAWSNSNPSLYFKMMAFVGSKFGEGRVIAGDNPTNTGAMSPEAARVKLDGLMADRDWFQRWEKGDVTARTEYKTLNGILSAAATKR